MIAAFLFLGCVANTQTNQTDSNVPPNALQIVSYTWNTANIQPSDEWVGLTLHVKSNVEDFVRITETVQNSEGFLADKNRQMVLVGHSDSPVHIQDYYSFRNYSESDVHLTMRRDAAQELTSINVCFETEWADTNIECTKTSITPLVINK